MEPRDNSRMTFDEFGVKLHDRVAAVIAELVSTLDSLDAVDADSRLLLQFWTNHR